MPLIHKTSAPEPIDDFDGWIQAFSQTSVLIEVGVLVACVLLAWGMVALLRHSLSGQPERSIWFGARTVDGVLFPFVLLCLAFVAREALSIYFSVALFTIAIPVLVALVAMRVAVKVLRAAFSEARWARALEQSFSWIAWLLMVLWVSGLLPVVLNELDQISWKVGNSKLSVRNMLEGAFTAAVVMIVTLWVSSGIESRLLRSATGSELSLRKAVSNATRATLLFLGLIVALSAVGIDLTALSVIGGAIGVGIGFGLQKLAANYVSGFVILAERSMRIGDFVRLDNFEGVVTQINARYTVVRALSGHESIVPNELLITARVENLSLGDPNVYQSTVVSVAYDSDVELVNRLLMQAAKAQPRVLTTPAPCVMLSHFGADGLEFTLAYWIADPQNGSGGLRSDINLAILLALRAHHIEIPYPQRVVRQA
jgi:small-conductance mechanosensitive channel